MTEPTPEQKARAWDRLSSRFRTTVFTDPTVKQLVKEIQDEMAKYLKDSMREDVTCRTCKYKTESNLCTIYNDDIDDLDDWCGRRDIE